MKKRKSIYMDYAATTPLEPKVLKAMLPYLETKFGNPSSLYSFGREAKKAVNESREKVARFLVCRPDEIIFTSSATESNNLAIIGTAKARKNEGRRIVISALEHKGISAACEELSKDGFDIVKVASDRKGNINPADVALAINEETILVSITMADNETGTLQPIGDIAKVIRKSEERYGREIYFHIDASQGAPHIDINTDKLGVSLLTFSAHKLSGPKGIACLFAKKGVKLQPVIFGGGQQMSIRSGTENTAAIVGFGRAVEIVSATRERLNARIAKLRDELEKKIIKTIPKCFVNGDESKRLPNFSNISFLDVEGEALLLYLDEAGVMVSTGSACNSDSPEPSAVLQAMGLPYEFIRGSIRFTLGTGTTKDDVDYTLKVLPNIIQTLRSVSS